MKYLTVVILCLCVCPFASIALAQAAQSQPTTPNFVIVNFNAVVLQSAEAQRDLGALQTKFAPREAHLQALNTEVESLRKQLTDTSSKLSQAEQSSRTQALDSKDKQLQREAEDFKSDSQSESQQVFQRIAQKVYTFLQSYSQQHGYPAVIERGSDANPVVWYSAANLDITDQLIKAYNAQSGAAISGGANNPVRTNPSKPSPSLPESPVPGPVNQPH
jgi:outer membrane protein